MFIGSRELRQEAKGAIEAVCLHTGHPRTEELVKRDGKDLAGSLRAQEGGGTPGLPDGVDFRAEQQANLDRFLAPGALGPELRDPGAARSEGLHLLQLRPGLRSHCDALYQARSPGFDPVVERS